MAGYPPPYPPPNSPFGYDARQQARVIRQQMKADARAQKAAFRARRDYYRYQNRAYRRSSILGPLLVLAAGVILLLIRLGRIPVEDFGDWYGRWWPLLLVGAGVILVAEWGFDQIPTSDGKPRVRRGIGGGAILLLILLTASGALVRHIHNSRDFYLRNFSLNPDTLDEFFGEKHEMSEARTADFPAGTSLVIDNPHGNVTIVGKSGDNQLHVTVNKQIYSSSDSAADSRAQQLSPRISQAGNVLSITLPSLSGASANLDITVPDFGGATVTANHGDVAVSGLHAPVSVTANDGNVEFSAITGAASARINHRDATFSARNIDGDLSVRGQAEDMTLSDIAGQVSLEGEFYGDSHFERLRGPFSFRTSRTQFNLVRLDGEINISPESALTGSQIVGPTSIKTRSRNITFDRIVGDVDVTNSDGSVDISSASPLGNVTVENKNGEVKIEVPQHSSFNLDAATTGGEIANNLNLKPTMNGDRAWVSGTIGQGGPKIVVHTTHLDIGIHEGEAAPPPPPAPPAPPKPQPKISRTTPRPTPKAAA